MTTHDLLLEVFHAGAVRRDLAELASNITHLINIINGMLQSNAYAKFVAAAYDVTASIIVAITTTTKERRKLER